MVKTERQLLICKIANAEDESGAAMIDTHLLVCGKWSGPAIFARMRERHVHGIMAVIGDDPRTLPANPVNSMGLG